MLAKFKIGDIYSVPILPVYYVITHIDNVSGSYKVKCYNKRNHLSMGGNNFSFHYMEPSYTLYEPYSLKKILKKL